MREIAAELDRTFGLWKPAVSGLQRAADSEIQRRGLMHRFVAVWLPLCERTFYHPSNGQPGLFIFDYFGWVRSHVPTMERSLRPLN